MTKQELLEQLKNQATEIKRLRAENDVLREFIGLEKKSSRSRCAVVPFTNKP